jgi:hypothetical protein
MATGYEPGLMAAQLERKAGIFACDEYTILTSTGNVTLGNDAYGPVTARHFKWAPVGISKDGTAGNAVLFMNAWDAVMAEGRLWNHDWVLKVDPDAVLLPDRLTRHLASHTGKTVYVVNCDKPGMQSMMFGSLEVFSVSAVRTYFKRQATCKWMSREPWGEDFFMGKCMTALGVIGVWDFDLVQDGVCKGAWCGSPTSAAFHPFKSLDSWIDCYNQATGKWNV